MRSRRSPCHRWGKVRVVVAHLDSLVSSVNDLGNRSAWSTIVIDRRRRFSSSRSFWRERSPSKRRSGRFASSISLVGRYSCHRQPRLTITNGNTPCALVKARSSPASHCAARTPGMAQITNVAVVHKVIFRHKRKPWRHQAAYARISAKTSMYQTVLEMPVRSPLGYSVSCRAPTFNTMPFFRARSVSAR